MENKIFFYMYVSVYACTGTREVDYLGEAGKTSLRDTVECGTLS